MKAVLIFAIALLSQVNFCYSQWVQTDGPFGKTKIMAIVNSDSLLLTSTSCGYFSKQQLTDSWTLNATSNFSCYTKKGDSLFIGGMNGGIQLIDLNYPGDPVVDVYPMPVKTLANSDSCLYAGAEMQGFLKSDNNGNTWNAFNSGLPTDTLWNPWVGTYYQTNVTDIEVTSNYIYCGTNKGVYRNSTNLNNWISINSGLPLSLVTVIQDVNDTLYTAISNNLYRSSDFGNSWVLVFTAPSNVSTLLAHSSGIYIGTLGDGVYLSTDNCQNWASLNTGLIDLGINTLSIYDTKVLCGTSESGIFYLQNGQWYQNVAGMICSSIRSMAVTNNHVIANDEDKVYKLNFSGNWVDVSPAVTYEMFSSLASKNDTVFLSVEYDTPTWPYDNPFIVYSTDNGNSWNSLISPVPFTRDDPYRIFFEDGRLYAYEDEKMYYTDNLGLSWNDISLSAQFCNGIYGFIVNNSIPFAAACGNGQLVKLDASQNWVLSNNGLPSNKEPLAFASCDSALFSFINFHGMYVSFDNGNQWSYANNGLVTSYSISDFTSSGSNLFVTSDYGVFVTSDFGQNWVAINDGLKNINTSSIRVLNDTLYVGTYGNGVWMRSIADIHVYVQEFQQSDRSIKVYPNPASDLIYVSSSSKDAKFTIIDLVGKAVLSGNLNSKNEINVSGLANGSYLVVFQLENSVQATKLLINR